MHHHLRSIVVYEGSVFFLLPLVAHFLYDNIPKARFVLSLISSIFLSMLRTRTSPSSWSPSLRREGAQGAAMISSFKGISGSWTVPPKESLEEDRPLNNPASLIGRPASYVPYPKEAFKDKSMVFLSLQIKPKTMSRQEVEMVFWYNASLYFAFYCDFVIFCFHSALPPSFKLRFGTTITPIALLHHARSGIFHFLLFHRKQEVQNAVHLYISKMNDVRVHGQEILCQRQRYLCLSWQERITRQGNIFYKGRFPCSILCLG